MFLRTILCCALFVAASTLSTAQLGGVSFLPKDCQASIEQNVKQTAGDARTIAIMMAKVQTKVGPIDLDVKFDLATGKSPLWAYVLYSQQIDSTFIMPTVRVLSCMSIPLPAGLNLPLQQVGTMPVPDDYLQGTELVARLQTDAMYSTYHAWYPDSTPSIVALAASILDIPGYPAGTPFWTLVFNGSGGTPAMTCLVHATNGEVRCVGEVPSSVAGDDERAGARVAPNPAVDHAAVFLPQAWQGRHVAMDMIDELGNVRVITPDVVAFVPAIHFSTAGMASGHYTLRLRSGQEAISLPMIIAK